MFVTRDSDVGSDDLVSDYDSRIKMGCALIYDMMPCVENQMIWGVGKGSKIQKSGKFGGTTYNDVFGDLNSGPHTTTCRSKWFMTVKVN